MPKLKNYGPGKRVNIWLPERSLKQADDIENLSQFFQIALEQRAGIMAWAIIKKQRGYNEPQPTQEQITEYNEKFPLDPLTAKRQGKWQPNSEKKPELW